MNIVIKSIAVYLITNMCLSHTSYAQVFNDWVARPNVSVKYKINKNLSLESTYYMYLEDNMSRYDKSVIGTEIGYKVNSWLKTGIEYRLGLKPGKKYHDMRYFVTFDHNLSKKWRLAYRPMLQQEFSSLKKELLAAKPIEYYWRNRLTVSYKHTRSLEYYLFTENYLEIEHGGMGFYRQKSALGADYKINARNEIGARFEMLNKKNGKNIARPNLSYTYTLGYVKKKK